MGTITLAPPPTMRELMDEPAFAAYMATPPNTRVDYGRGRVREHPGLTGSAPWQLVVRTDTGAIRTARFDTYTAGYDRFRSMLDRDDVADVTLMARRMFFAPPGHWVTRKFREASTGRVVLRDIWVDYFSWPGFDWCTRCRRPSRFMELPPNHYVFRLNPVMRTDEDPFRCITCGIRFAAIPPNPDLWMIVETES